MELPLLNFPNRVHAAVFEAHGSLSLLPCGEAYRAKHQRRRRVTTFSNDLTPEIMKHLITRTVVLEGARCLVFFHEATSRRGITSITLQHATALRQQSW